MRPLEVFALDRDFNRLTGSIPYTSLQWCRRYYEPGTFEIHVLSSVYSPDWAYIYTEDRPETGIIQKREYTDDQEVAGGEDTIRLLGYFTERWLYDYTFLIEDSKGTEEEYIFKPAPKTTFAGTLPELYQDGLGNTYVMRGEKLWTADGTPTNYTTNGMTRLEYDMAPGVIASVDNSGRPLWYQDTGFNYFDKDGDLYRVSAIGSAEPHKVDASAVVPITVTGNTFGASDGVVYNEGGSWYWFGSYSRREEDTWIRQVDKWEERTAGLQTNPGGSVAVRYRVVKGPWNLRTNVDEVGVPRDNLQAIISWAQRMWGNSMLYDEPGFEGETKVLDANLKNFGDFTFSELKTIGASVRVFYSFVSNTTIFQIWRGRDLTQETNAPKVSERAARAEVATLPSGYTELEYIQGTGTQYINTGFSPDQNTRVTLDIESDGTIPESHVAGSRVAANNKCFSLIVSADGVWRDDYGAEQTNMGSAPLSGSIHIDKNGRVTTIGSASTTHKAATFSNGLPMFIFAVNTNGTIIGKISKFRLMSCEIYDNGELVREFHPARQDGSGSIGLYDTVSSTFFENAGTGTFIAGPDVPEPEPSPEEFPPWTVFSDTWGTMHGFTYSVDDSNYRNKCYVMYEYDEPMQWLSDGSPYHTDQVILGSDNELDTIQNYPGPVADHVPYTTKQGYETVRLEDDYRDIECYLDLRDDKPEFDQDWPRGGVSDGTDDSGEEPPDWESMAGMKEKYEAWHTRYKSAGQVELSSGYPIERTLNTGTLSQDDYLEVWDLGDIVDMAIHAMGVTQIARVTGVDEVHESGSSTIHIQLGEVRLAATEEE